MRRAFASICSWMDWIMTCSFATSDSSAVTVLNSQKTAASISGTPTTLTKRAATASPTNRAS